MPYFPAWPSDHTIPVGTVGEIKRFGSDQTLVDFGEKLASARWLRPHLFREIDAIERLALLHEA